MSVSLQIKDSKIPLEADNNKHLTALDTIPVSTEYKVLALSETRLLTTESGDLTIRRLKEIHGFNELASARTLPGYWFVKILNLLQNNQAFVWFNQNRY